MTKGDAQNAARAVRAAEIFGDSYETAMYEVCIVEERLSYKDCHKVENEYYIMYTKNKGV